MLAKAMQAAKEELRALSMHMTHGAWSSIHGTAADKDNLICACKADRKTGRQPTDLGERERQKATSSALLYSAVTVSVSAKVAGPREYGVRTVYGQANVV